MYIFIWSCLGNRNLERILFLIAQNRSQFIKNQNTLFEGRSHASSSNFYFPFPFFEDFKICSFNSFIILSNFSLASRSCLSSSWSSCLSASAWSNLCLNSASCKIEERQRGRAKFSKLICEHQLFISRCQWWPPYASDKYFSSPVLISSSSTVIKSYAVTYYTFSTWHQYAQLHEHPTITKNQESLIFNYI